MAIVANEMNESNHWLPIYRENQTTKFNLSSITKSCWKIRLCELSTQLLIYRYECIGSKCTNICTYIYDMYLNWVWVCVWFARLQCFYTKYNKTTTIKTANFKGNRNYPFTLFTSKLPKIVSGFSTFICTFIHFNWFFFFLVRSLHKNPCQNFARYSDKKSLSRFYMCI